MSNIIKKFAPLAFILIILVAQFWLTHKTGRNSAPVQVSGTIEAVEIRLRFEAGGQIAEVLVDEGDRVQAGEVLVKLEDQVLQAQLGQAEAALLNAEASYRLIAAEPLTEQRQVAINTAQLELLQAQQALKNLVEDADLSRALAWQAVEEAENDLNDLLDPALQQAITIEAIAEAEKSVDQAQKELTILTTPPSQPTINQAYANMLLAERVLDETIEDLEWAEEKLQGNLGPKIPKPFYIIEYKAQFRQAVQNLEIKLSRDQLAYQHAAEKFNDLMSPPDPVELALAQASLGIAEARLKAAQVNYERIKDGPSQADIAVLEEQVTAVERDYQALKDGPDPDDLALAQVRVQRAEANLAFAQADTRSERLAVAQAQVDAAQAALQVIKIQLDKLVLIAPVDGIVLSCDIEPGEVVKMGRHALTLGRLDDLTIGIYLPADYQDHISMGDDISVTLDAFPGEIFSARVTSNPGEAEFALRNVGANGDRREAVFLLELTLHDPTGVLKPGMHAQVEIRDQ